MCEINGLNDKVYIPSEWKEYNKESGSYLEQRPTIGPLGVSMQVVDSRNAEGYGAIDYYILQTERVLNFEIFKDPVDDKEKYYFRIKDNASGLGKYMFITDEDCSPSSVVDGSFMSTFTDDVCGWETDHPEPNENKFIVEDKKKATNKAK